MISIAALTQRMIACPGNTPHDVGHLLKAWAYARTIGELEGLDENTQYTLEIAALTHDIACPMCRKTYGHCAGPLQEREGALLVRAFLKDTDVPEAIIERVAYLVGHHHTLNAINGVDYQILIEADYLVNAQENDYSGENARNFAAQYFKTQAGTQMLHAIYPVRI